MSEPRWLSESEQTVWRSYLDTSQQLWERLEDDLVEAAGMPMPEYEILVRLSEAPERRLRMSELAALVVHSRSRLSHTVRRMEKRRLVSRSRDERDGRGVQCELLDAGFDRLVAAAPVHVESVRTHLFDPLTPAEAQMLGRLMDKVGAKLTGG